MCGVRERSVAAQEAKRRRVAMLLRCAPVVVVMMVKGKGSGGRCFCQQMRSNESKGAFVTKGLTLDTSVDIMHEHTHAHCRSYVCMPRAPSNSSCAGILVKANNAMK